MKNSHSQDSKKQEKVATVMGPGMLGGPWGHPFSSLGLCEVGTIIYTLITASQNGCENQKR